MALFQMDTFLCWKLKVATFVFCIITICLGAIAALLELLDVLAWDPTLNFEIPGGFKSGWRAHAWEGWLAVSILMFLIHIGVICLSVLLIIAIKRFPTYYEFTITKWYLGIFVCYILIELGCGLYKYSYYAHNTFRLGYLVFTFIYWVLRILINVTGAVIISSRIAEVAYEIKFGEKRDLSGWTSKANLLDVTGFRSGFTTPRGK